MQIYRAGKKPLPIHWQALYISCHWNDIFALVKTNNNAYFKYKLIILSPAPPPVAAVLPFKYRVVRAGRRDGQALLEAQAFPWCGIKSPCQTPSAGWTNFENDQASDGRPAPTSPGSR
jgi:hypothetical protein